VKKKMTPKQLANLKPFKKGNKANPTGKNNPELTKIRGLTAFELQQIAGTLVRKDRKELRRLSKSNSESGLTAMVAAIAVKAIDNGDDKRFDVLMNRIVGKVSDKLQMFGPDDDTNKADKLTETEKLAIFAKNSKDLKVGENE
jgi:hypothetical protein